MNDKSIMFPDLPCALADCKERASFVTVQTNELNLLFNSMAGVVCKKHAKALARVGGAPFAFADLGKIEKRQMP